MTFALKPRLSLPCDWLRGGRLHQRLQLAKHPHQRDPPGEGGPHCHRDQWSGKGEPLHILTGPDSLSQSAAPVVVNTALVLSVCLPSFLDLREGFHFGDPAGRTGSSRRGGAGVWARAPLCLCSGLQLCLEVEDQRWSSGDQMNRRAPPCHGHSVMPTFHTCGLLSNYFNARGPGFLLLLSKLPCFANACHVSNAIIQSCRFVTLNWRTMKLWLPVIIPCCFLQFSIKTS